MRDRKQAALDAYNHLQEQALNYINYYRPEQVKKIAQNPSTNEYKKIRSYIARIEHFCAGVVQKIYDQKNGL